MNKELMHRLEKSNEYDLLIFIGNELFQDEIQSLSLHPKDILKKTNEWISSKTTILKKKLCSNETIKKGINDETLEKSALILHVAELLADFHDSRITIYAIAVYFVNFGYKQICHE